jgi:hypothetical protein
VVVIWNVTFPETFVFGGAVQIDAEAGSEQVKATIPEKPLLSVSVTVALTFDPCATWKLVAVGARVNGVEVVVAIDAA